MTTVMAAELDDLAMACHQTLARLAAGGGPSLDAHLDDLRRWLTRRSPRGGDRARRAVASVRAGRAEVVGSERIGDRRAFAALAADLRAIDRALQSAHRVHARL